MRRRGWLLGGLLALAAGLATFGSAAPAPAAEGPRVFMVDNEPDLTRWHFDPAEISVPAGATVVWTNQGKEDHTVTADDNSFDSGYKKSGTTFQRAFPRPGKYSYHCSPHPWMKGTVLVVAGAAAPTGAAEATTSTTAAPAASSSTFPPLTAPGAVPPEETSTSAPAATAATGPGSDSGASAAPASSRKRSGGNLAGTLAIVLLPTLGGLAIGARLRRSKA